jgi:hypothetical protein
MPHFQYRVIPVEGPIRRGVVTWPKRPTFNLIDRLVKPLIGGSIEHISVLDNGQRRDMFVDDEGKKKGLPRNRGATAIYRAHTLTLAPDMDPEDLPEIVGPAVIFARRMWF